ncbi:hypothetical protein BV898_06701 [Hypsibius exemplaris]|uniref:LITAF domain-containing protein n=1 Tax=Hypsibius exemplaris TaxID=2072580 RepID=A0A1W0WVN7_HYPEX|nr:hypothetical protein BV898_06701 [Hypsibius exemplaris]
MSSPARPPGSPAPSVPPPKTLQPGAGAGSQQPDYRSIRYPSGMDGKDQPGSPAPGEQVGPPPPYSNQPQYQQQPQHQHVQQVQYVQQPIVTLQAPVMIAHGAGGMMYSPAPTVMQCPSCRQQMVTQVRYEPGCCAWLGVGACLLIGCWMGCCLIPLCMKEFQDAIHTCPQCHQYLGTYQRL